MPGMQWSKLKARVRSLMCPELKDTIDFHVTSYRKAHSWISESWITINGTRVFDCGSRTYSAAGAYEVLANPDSPELVANLPDILYRREIHAPQYMGQGLRAYLDLPIEEALRSENPFIKAFAVIDRRVGKRTLASLVIEPEEHSLVKKFYQLRCQAADITSTFE